MTDRTFAFRGLIAAAALASGVLVAGCSGDRVVRTTTTEQQTTTTPPAVVVPAPGTTTTTTTRQTIYP